MENRVALGATATFECNVTGNVEVRQYDWVASDKIARDGRFSYGESMKILYVNNVKDYDNQTFVDCTVTVVDGRTGMDNGRIFVLPGVMVKNGTMEELPSTMGKDATMNELPGTMGPIMGRNGTILPSTMGKDATMEELPGTMGPIMGRNGTMEGGEIPPLTAGGGVVIAFGFILVIIAMIGALKWLKREEIQKVQDMETARNRYSRIETGHTASSRAHYERDQGNIRLGSYKDEEEANDDSYEDMSPVVPKMNVQGGSARDSPRGASRGGPGSGHGRHVPPPRR